jgi:gliding motility-associated-like protein
MKKKIIISLVSAFALLFVSGSINAQVPFKYLSYVFPSDSLAGFDEDAAKKEALNRGFFGSEYHVIMYSMKRNFINQKYGFTPPPTMNNSGTAANAKGSNPTVLNAPCVNEDFEASPSTAGTTSATTVGTTLAGWQVSWGQNSGTNGSCTQAGCCPSPGSNDAWVRTTPWVAPAPLGTIPNSPFGGTKVLQMNDNLTWQGEVVRIQQTFPVTATNCFFQLAYMAAMDGSGHACCDQPFMRIDLLDCFNTPLACPQVSITPPGASCATSTPVGWTTNTSGISWTSAWQVKAIDLTPYIGSCITIKITVGDCDGWAHYGYAFIDCVCQAMTINVNNIPFAATNAPVVAVAACGITTATMVAPPGLGPYVWQGPAGSGVTSNTNQSITTTVAGNYTLTMNPLGSCAPVTKTVNLQFGSFPLATFTSANSCTTYSFTNTGTGPPSVQTYSFAGAGAPSSFTTTNAVSVVNFAPSTTYTVYHTVVNPQNCPATATMVITTPAGPTPAFTAAPSFTQCLVGNAFTFNATTTTGTHTYNFSPASGAPPTGTGGSSYGPVNFTTVGTYTVIHTVNSGGCVTSTQSVVTVNSAPTATATGVNPPCAGSAATLTGVGGPGTISWAGPNGYVGVGGNASVPNFQTVNNGTYTMTVNNFGCITTRTVQLTLGAVPTVTVTNNGPYCVGQTFTLNAAVSTGTAGITWSYWYNSTFTWYNFTTTTTPTITNNATGTSSGVFYFYVSFAGGCWATASTTVNVVANPTVSATNTGPYCAGQTIQLNSPTAAGSYTWTGPGGYVANSQNPTRATSTPAMSGIYTVMIGAGSCTAIATTSVTVNPASTPTLGSNSPVCSGGNLNLTALGGTTFTWTGPGGYTAITQNPTIANVTPAQAGIYTLTANSGGSCISTGTINVIVTTATASAANTGPYCAGATINLSTSAATTYSWTGPNGFSSNLQNPTIFPALIVCGGPYTLISTTGGCNAVAITTIVVNPVPVVVVSHPTVCVGSTIPLTSSGGSTYNWSGPGGFTSGAQNPTIANSTTGMQGVYTVTVTDVNGCVSTANANIGVAPIPTPNALTAGPACVGTTLSLSGSGGTTYSWSGPNGFSSAAQNPSITGVTLAAGGIYTLTASSGTCFATTTVSATVNPLPTPVAANNNPVCLNQPATFTGNGGVSYSWSGPGGYASSVQNPTITSAGLSNNGVYILTVTGANGCTNTTNVNLVVNPLPVIGVTHPTVCVNQTIPLTSNGGVTYNWSGPGGFTSGAQNPTIANSTTGMQGVYTVTVTDGNGCVNTANANIGVAPIPVPVANTAGPVCVGATLMLTGSGGTTYSWSGPNGFSSALQNPNIANVTLPAGGIYTVTASSGTCAATTTVQATVNALPVPVAANNNPVCLNQPINFTGNGGVSYNWSGPGGYASSAQNPSIGSAALSNTGSYTLTVTDANGCINTTNVNLTVNPLPVVTVNNPVACVNNNIALTSTGGVTYSWSGPGGYTSASQNPNIPNATLAMVGSYIVTVTNGNGCVNTAAANVGVTPLPTPNALTAGPVCTGATLAFTGSGGTTYSWSGPNGFSSVAQNPTIPNSTTPATGIYTLAVTTGSCSNTTTVQALVNALPVANIISNSPICNGQALNLTGNGGTSYTWIGPGGFNTTNQNPSIPTVGSTNGGTYTLTVVDANGCMNSTTSMVTVNPLPTPLAIGSTVCQNQNATLMAGGGTSFSWTGPNGFTSTSQSPLIVGAALVDAGSYTVLVTDANTCTNTAVTTIIVNPLPNATIQSNSPICINNQLTLSASGGVSYSWSGPNGFASGLQAPSIMANSTAYSGNYAVTVVDANGCTASSNLNAVINPLPNATIVASNVKGCSPLCATFTVQSTPPVSTAGWVLGNGAFSNGVTNTNACYASTGVYSISANVVDANGCSTTAYTSVEVFPAPVADFNHSPIKPVINIDAEVTFTDASHGATINSWNWYLMNTAQYQSIEQNPHFTYLEPGNYPVALVVKSDQGCADTIVRVVEVGEDFGIYTPNAFSPNGDGLNDTFQPKGFGITKYEMQIFDRWGEVLFQTNEFEKGWDGMFASRPGKICPTDTYTWRIKLTTVFGKAHEFTGHVTLMK